MKKLSLLITIGLVAILVSSSWLGCGQKEKVKASYKIGINNALTGGFAVYAVDYQKVYEMLAEKINAEGGVNGHKIELVVRDSESDAVTSANNVRALASAGVLTIIGSPDFGLALGDVKVSEEVKVPYIIQTPLDPPYSPGGYAFGWVGSTIQGMIKGWNLSSAEHGLRRLALLEPKDPVGETQSDLQKKLASETGVEIAGHEWMLLTDTDVVPQLTKLKATKPNAIANGGSGKAAVVIYKSLKRFGWDIPMICNAANATPSFIEAMGEDAPMALVWVEATALRPDTIPSDYPTRDLIVETAKMWEARTGKPFGSIAGWGYDALRSVVAVLQTLKLDPSTGKIEEMRNKIRESLENQSFQGLEVAIRRTPNDHKGAEQPRVWIAKIEGKYFVPITDADLAKYRKK